MTAVSPTDDALAPRTASRCDASTPGGPPEQAGPVQGDHGDLVALDDRGRAAAGDERELVLAQRGGLGHGLAGQHGADPAHQVGDQAGLPVVPRRRAGGQPVRVDSACSSSSSGPRADRRRDLLHGHRVVQVPPGRDLGEQQVVADRGGDQLRVGLAEADPLAHVAGDHLAGDAVVAGPALADVVQQRGEQQQVGPRHVAGVGGGVGRALDEVPVHGETVQRVALRAVAHPLPVRDQRGEQALLVERLPDGDRVLPGAEQGEQLVARLVRPRDRQRRALGEPGQGARRERQARLGGRGGGPQHEHGVGRRGRGPREHDLALLLHHAVGERAALRPAAAHPHAECAAAARPVRHAEGVVDRVGDGAARAGQLAQQRVAVEEVERARDLVLLLEHEPVQAAAR